MCPHCHEDIAAKDPTLVIGGRSFHRNCWIRELIGPTEKRNPGKTKRQETDAAVSAWRRSGLDVLLAGYFVTHQLNWSRFAGRHCCTLRN